MGARCAGASEARAKAWYDYGLHVGLAFQIQDDYLDTFGASGSTGKQVGGDILADKKTLLWLTAEADPEAKPVLDAWKGISPATGTEQAEAKIDAVRAAMLAAGADDVARALMAEHVGAALQSLASLELSADQGAWFEGLAQHVTSRTH
jgi:geranylgeranyl diphosphate synthase type II